MRLPLFPAFALAAAACVALAEPAQAADIDLSWDTCIPTGGSPVAHRAAGPPGPYTITLNGRGLSGQIRTTSFVFELRSPNGLPPAWRFDPAGCAAGGLQFSTSSVSKACPAVGGLPSTQVTYALDPSGRAATLSISTLYGGSSTLSPGANYLLGRILLDFSNATATGSGSGCEGLDAPVCITLVEATIQHVGQAEPENLVPGQSFLTWNDPGGLTVCSGQSLQGVHVSEFTVACASNDYESHFLELKSPARGTPLLGDLHLRTEDAFGTPRSDVAVVTPGDVVAAWPGGASWLIGTATFEQGASLAADRVLPPFLDAEGGRIVLYDSRPGGGVVQEFPYGGSAPDAAPLPGQSLVRQTSGAYAVSSAPDPRNFSGATSPGVVCVPTTGSRFRIRQIAYACLLGSTAGQFVEVSSVDASPWSGDLILDVLDENGIVVLRSTGVFGAKPGFVTLPGVRSWIVATSQFAGAAGLTPDRTWSGFPVDGTWRFRLHSPETGTKDEVVIGPGGTAPAPPNGYAIEFLPGGAHTMIFPSPRNGTGVRLPQSPCFPGDTGPLFGQLFAIRQIAYSCMEGSTAGQFIEVESLTDSAWAGNLVLEVTNEQGVRLVQSNPLFGSAPNIPGRRSWLVARSGFQAATGFVPDLVWAGFTPANRTTFRLNSQSGTIAQVSIGPTGTAPAPPPGWSVRLYPDSSHALLFPPDPRNASGALLPVSVCFPADTSWTPNSDAVHFSELSTRCDYADEGAQFLELRADGSDQVFDSHTAIQIFSVNGTLTATLTGLFGAHPDGTAWPEGQTWLLAKGDFSSAAGFPADGTCPRLDPAGGVVRLYDTRTPWRAIDEIRYGPGTVLHSLPPRQSIQRALDGTLSVRAPLSPTNSLGQTTDSLDCPYPLSLVRISEVSTRCENGEEGSQFIEIRSEGRDQIHDSHAVLQVFDADGTLTWARGGLFGTSPDGTPWPEGQTWLLAAENEFISGAGFPSDGLASRLDPAGGRVRLYDSRLPARTIDEVAYGPGTSLPAPSGGQSIQRGLDGAVTVTGPVSPTNSSGQTTASPGCPCPHAEYNWGGLFRSTDAATYDSTYGGNRIRFTRAQPSILVSSGWGSAGVTLPDRFTIVGAPAGAEVTIIGMFHIVGGGGGGCSPVHGCASGSGALTWASGDSSGTIGSWVSVNQTYLMTLRVRIGEPFPFSWRLAGEAHYLAPNFGYFDFSASFEWANLPPGTHMESCMGYFDDTPVAAIPTLLDSRAEPGLVHLEWSAPDDASRVDVERRDEESDWRVVVTLPASRSEPIVFEDRDVVPGGRYAYRLAWLDAAGTTRHTAESWIDVPGAAFSARLASGTITRGSVELALTLPSTAPVSAELFDLRGRRLATRSWTPDAAGAATFRLAPERALAPGVYWIRVVQGTDRATLRAVVVASTN